MIEVKNLTRNYGPVPAVKGISFTVEKGHIYGFLGPNGAGKSTTMNMITGCLAPTDGEITVDGHDIYEDAIEAKRCIGYLPELPPLYTDMTPFEYLEFVGRAKGLRKSELYNELEDVMKRTGITDVADRLIRNLSKGYRQRVGIAQAILGNPDIIILDEPTVGLDPIQIIEIRNLIKELGEEHTVILSSHILQEISAVCDYVIMISQGRIVASDTIENLLADSSGDSVLKIETDGTEEAARTATESIDGVTFASYSTSNGHTLIELHTAKEVDIGDNVFMALRGAGMNVVSMTNNESSLEEVFVRLAGESLDAGAAYADEKAQKKRAKASKKVIGESDLGSAYYSETYVDSDGSENGEAAEDSTPSEPASEPDTDSGYKPLFENKEETEDDKK